MWNENTTCDRMKMTLCLCPNPKNMWTLSSVSKKDLIHIIKQKMLRRGDNPRSPGMGPKYNSIILMLEVQGDLVIMKVMWRQNTNGDGRCWPRRLMWCDHKPRNAGSQQTLGLARNRFCPTASAECDFFAISDFCLKTVREYVSVALNH